MKITFFSNFLNHHQLPLCQEIVKLVGDSNFRFVACTRIEEERVRMGYEDMNIKYQFVLRAYENDKCYAEALDLAEKSDVAIIGSADIVFTKIRGRLNRLTFFYRERLFKNGVWHMFYPPLAYSLYNTYTKYRKKNFYILSASAYTSSDVRLLGFNKNKCLKWGYFPELLPKSIKSYDKLKIMWCGRMLWWKHPEDAVEVARLLSFHGIDFEMKIIGNGEQKRLVDNLIFRHNLQDKITMYDFMSPSEIRTHMNESNIYLFTSGRQEGWGVVLNEAMNSSCAVIANANAGSSPYLINDNVNGFLYDGSKYSLANAVNNLLKSDLKLIGANAYNSISNLWSPQIAADRIVRFSEAVLSDRYLLFENGPCSKA